MGHFIRHIVEIYSAIVAIPSFLLGMWTSRIIGKIRRRKIADRRAEQLDRVNNQ